MRPLAEVSHDLIGGGIRESGFSCGGTGSKFVARHAGAPEVIGAPRALFTGCLPQAAEMISISYFRVGL